MYAKWKGDYVTLTKISGVDVVAKEVHHVEQNIKKSLN